MLKSKNELKTHSNIAECNECINSYIENWILKNRYIPKGEYIDKTIPILYEVYKLELNLLLDKLRTHFNEKHLVEFKSFNKYYKKWKVM